MKFYLQPAIINTFGWSFGAPLMVTTATLMTKLCTSDPGLAQMVYAFSMTVAASGSFMIMLFLAIAIPPVEFALVIAYLGGWMIAAGIVLLKRSNRL